MRRSWHASLVRAPRVRETARVVVVVFPAVLQRHVACPPVEVEALTVHAALVAAFVQLPAVRGYVFDEDDQLRHHMAVFVDGVPVRDRRLLQPLAKGATVQVLQALSGG